MNRPGLPIKKWCRDRRNPRIIRTPCPKPPTRPAQNAFVVAAQPFAPAFGGTPAGGFFPFSNSSPAPAPAPSPTPTPTPTPPPTPTCVTADIFSDCFAACSGGPIDAATPGPICGWTFSTAFGNKGGQVTFTPGVMSLEALGGGSDTPGAFKSLPAPLVTVLNESGQFKFTEFPASAGDPNAQYQFFLLSVGLTEFLQIFLGGSGTAIIASGPPGAADAYIGTWTPNNGTHKVDYTLNAANVPTLTIDDIPIPLTFLGTGFSILGSHASNAVELFAFWPPMVANSEVLDVFVASGIRPATNVYCCP